MNTVEIIGYFASFFVAASFLVPNNIRLVRTINMIGAILFVIYGFYIDSFPIIIPNVLITGIQVYYLFLHKQKKKE